MDISFLYGPASDLHLRSKELLKEELVFIGPPGSLEASGGQIGLDEVADHPLVLHGRRYAMRRLIENAAKKAGTSLTIAYEVDSYFATKSMVMSGICHAFLPLASLMEEVSSGALEARSIEPDGLWRDVVLGLPSERSNTRAANADVEILMSEIAMMISDGEWIAQPGPDLRAIT